MNPTTPEHNSDNHATESEIKEVFTVKPPVTRKEQNCLHIIAWTLAIIIHLAAAYGIGWLIDWKSAQFDVEMNWGNELTGFGMMAEYYEDPPEIDAYEPPPEVEATEEIFEQETEESIEPPFDPDSIFIPEPEPEEQVEEEPQKEEKPSHDLRKDKAKLAAVKADISTMPNLHLLAPGNARVIVLVRNDRLIGSRFEAGVRKLFKSFPDYQVALGASDIDPVKDIQALLIATANPQLYAETFLVVSHKIPSDHLKQYINKSFPTKLLWKEQKGKPLAVPDSTDGKYNPNSGIYKRVLYLANDNTVLFLKPEVLPTLDVAHVDAIVNTRDDELEQDKEKAQTFLQSLGGIAVSDSASTPTIFLMVQGIQNVYLGRGMPEFNVPAAVMGSMSTANNPHLNIQATFNNADDAKQFVDKWPDIVSAASSMGVPGVGGLLNALSLTNEDNQVLATGDLNGAMISLVLMFASSYLERINK